MEVSTVRLRALSGAPLKDPKVRAMVVATAEAIAERTGVTLAGVHAEDHAVTVTLPLDKLACLGFLAELRRLTNAWYAGKHHGLSLWGDEPDVWDAG
ncbi:MAG: hypothetical protein HRU70_12560 [Phycisphaeraceae bacterium]|nr:MAG: hypothetical protein HRU70_12560 [Phycisphaeraceae bacterium]